MAKSKWPQVQEKLVLVEAWCRDGRTDADIADKLGISESTFYNYKLQYAEFLEALKKGKEVVDVEVENALFKKAKGYIVKVKKTFKVKVAEFDAETGKKIFEREELRVGFDEVYIPADVTAQMFWLQNRKPDTWRRNQEPLIGEEALQKLDGILEGITRKMADDDGD